MKLGHEGWCIEKSSGRKEALDTKGLTFSVLKKKILMLTTSEVDLSKAECSR